MRHCAIPPPYTHKHTHTHTRTRTQVYDLQFGAAFDRLATDPSNSDAIERDDFALEIANMDE